MSLVKLSIKGISYSHTQNGAYALILNEVGGERKLPIVIGAFEAQSIAIAIEKDIKPPRPLTHDLFKNFADRFEIKLKKVIIHKLVDGIFFSSIICEKDGVEEVIDARTSDAIALAIRFFAPVYTYMSILDKAGIILNTSPLEESQKESISKINQDTQIQNEDFKEYSLSELYDLLDETVQKEDYEKAVLIRDEISKRKI